MKSVENTFLPSSVLWFAIKLSVKFTLFVQMRAVMVSHMELILVKK